MVDVQQMVKDQEAEAERKRKEADAAEDRLAKLRAAAATQRELAAKEADIGRRER